jgi:hypothetical protein
MHFALLPPMFGSDGARDRNRKRYPSDVADGSREFVAPCLVLTRAPLRDLALRDAFDALRRVVKAGAHQHRLPGDSPWPTVYRQGRR